MKHIQLPSAVTQLDTGLTDVDVADLNISTYISVYCPYQRCCCRVEWLERSPQSMSICAQGFNGREVNINIPCTRTSPLMMNDGSANCRRKTRRSA